LTFFSSFLLRSSAFDIQHLLLPWQITYTIKKHVYNIENAVSLVGCTGRITTSTGIKNGNELCRSAPANDYDISLHSFLLRTGVVGEIKLINSIANWSSCFGLTVFSRQNPGLA